MGILIQDLHNVWTAKNLVIPYTVKKVNNTGDDTYSLLGGFLPSAFLSKDGAQLKSPCYWSVLNRNVLGINFLSQLKRLKPILGMSAHGPQVVNVYACFFEQKELYSPDNLPQNYHVMLKNENHHLFTEELLKKSQLYFFHNGKVMVFFPLTLEDSDILCCPFAISCVKRLKTYLNRF